MFFLCYPLICIMRTIWKYFPMENPPPLPTEKLGKLTPLPPGKFNPFCGGGMDIFWDHTNYSTRTCASLIVPRFNTRYMKDSVAFRGSVLWNAVTNNCSALTKNIPYRDLRLKLKSQANFNEFSFKITSASTCNFRKDDFVYT